MQQSLLRVEGCVWYIHADGINCTPVGCPCLPYPQATLGLRSFWQWVWDLCNAQFCDCSQPLYIPHPGGALRSVSIPTPPAFMAVCGPMDILQTHNQTPHKKFHLWPPCDLMCAYTP
uniref:Uncharacterized protein n=1 Tax=Eutreptiella gymnastica TaxID=73025 RepID=A0A7S1I817_9EUGL